MGRPPKDDDLHELAGTRSKADPGAPPLEAGRPRCPANLSNSARKAFRALVRTLAARRTLTAGDAEALRLYAVIFDRHERAILHLQQEGEICQYERLDSNGQPHTFWKENLWCKIAQDCESKMRGLLSDFGLNPMSRPRVKPTKEAGDGIIFK